MRKQFNPEPKRLTLVNVKANPDIQSLSKNPTCKQSLWRCWYPMETRMIKCERNLRDIDILAVIDVKHFDYIQVINILILCLLIVSF